MKILIADDDFTNRVIMQEILRSCGTSHVAVNGVEAVEAVRTSLEVGENPYSPLNLLNVGARKIDYLLISLRLS